MKNCLCLFEAVATHALLALVAAFQLACALRLASFI